MVHAGGAAGLVPPSRAAAAGAKAEAAEPRGVGGAQEVGVAVSGGAVEAAAAAAAAVELGDGSFGTTAGCSVGGWQGRPARLGGDGDRWSGDGERVLTEGSDGPLPGGGDGNVAGDAGATYSGVLSARSAEKKPLKFGVCSEPSPAASCAAETRRCSATASNRPAPQDMSTASQ